MFVFAIGLSLMYACGGGLNEDEEGKVGRVELKSRIKEMEDSISDLQANLSQTKTIPNLTHFELINRLLDYYHAYPEDDYAAECLDKVHMKYAGLNILTRAVQYADTLLEKYPNYINRAMVLESQGSSYEYIQPRDTSKIRYYYTKLLKENPKMDREKREGIKLRLRHLDLTFEEFIDYQMNEISKR
jgi:tetratricopeptide (TPR) repeat protein